LALASPDNPRVGTTSPSTTTRRTARSTVQLVIRSVRRARVGTASESNNAALL
jgi:hypothetical protein